MFVSLRSTFYFLFARWCGGSNERITFSLLVCLVSKNINLWVISCIPISLQGTGIVGWKHLIKKGCTWSPCSTFYYKNLICSMSLKYLFSRLVGGLVSQVINSLVILCLYNLNNYCLLLNGLVKTFLIFAYVPICRTYITWPKSSNCEKYWQCYQGSWCTEA